MQRLSSESAYFPLGLPLSREAWARYRVSELIDAGPRETDPGTVAAVRHLADRMNAQRGAGRRIEPIKAGRLLAAGLFTDILRHLTDRYCLADYPGVALHGLETVKQVRGVTAVERPIHAFVDLYPPRAVATGGQAERDYLEGKEGGNPNRYKVARELAILRLTIENPALAGFLDLYDDTELKRQAAYEILVDGLERFFETQPPFPDSRESLFEFLRAPVRACPDSIEGQLEYVLRNWAQLLPQEIVRRLQLAADIIKEEVAMRGHGPGPVEVLHFGVGHGLDLVGYPEPAAFTIDKDWMSNVVLIAKCVYVWLDQLSKQYQRPIIHLDQVPDEELDRLARWGFTGLWLIGVWERSPASQAIKQHMGNPEAAASAYSLYDYVIAADLGGDAAYNNLRERARRRGIRLASDMVPNHMGVYSRWVIEHPDWFLQLEQPPYPSYRFTGPNLSLDARIGLFIEDGYWEHRDAAVVFKRVDHWTGSERYVYHGNDGTNMPWNDTAQLNFLLPEVREAVVQTILHVARQFPIIRFDAAMTLAKRHYQRLWFPKPGDAGAVPSRAEHGMSREQFDDAFPKEFWREVVDRIQQELPDTLLLAEAFWLMEGYFVRTLGMHRVYNSAFMNMLMQEENLKYRMTVKNVLEFSPEVLNRFVNFMNNPDERTAVDQFGKGDKYFGIALMMVTMPGLPMFGHGQIEGFAEKYGMEYRRAYWDESVDWDLVRRHETEIFPLMRRRELFSGSEHFALFDARTPDGWVDENVFAYSNRAGSARALIVYNNAYTTTRITVHRSSAINEGDAENKQLRFRSVAEALDLDDRENCFYIFRDWRTRLEYLRHAPHIAQEGLSFELHAYESHAFLDFREVYDTDGTWERLNEALGGKGVPSMEDAYREMVFEPIHAPFRKVMNAEMLRALAGPAGPELRADFADRMATFLETVIEQSGIEIDPEKVVERTWLELDTLKEFPARLKKLRPGTRVTEYLLTPIPTPDADGLAFWRIPIALAITQQTARIRAAADYSAQATAKMDEWLLTKVVTEAFEQFEDDPVAARMDALLVKVLASYPTVLDFFPGAGGAVQVRRMFEDVAVQRYLLMNRFEDAVWINKEQAEKLLYWLCLESVVALGVDGRLTKQTLKNTFDNAGAILDAVQAGGYQVEKALQLLAQET